MISALLAAIAIINALGLWILTDIKTDLREMRERVQKHESFIAALRAGAVLKGG